MKRLPHEVYCFHRECVHDDLIMLFYPFNMRDDPRIFLMDHALADNSEDVYQLLFVYLFCQTDKILHNMSLPEMKYYLMRRKNKNGSVLNSICVATHYSLDRVPPRECEITFLKPTDDGEHFRAEIVVDEDELCGLTGSTWPIFQPQSLLQYAETLYRVKYKNSIRNHILCPVFLYTESYPSDAEFVTINEFMQMDNKDPLSVSFVDFVNSVLQV